MNGGGATGRNQNFIGPPVTRICHATPAEAEILEEKNQSKYATRIILIQLH